MKNLLIYFLVSIFIVSCSSIDKKLFKSEKSNYIKTNEGDFIKANYTNVNEINPKTKNQVIIKNSKDKPMYVFSTVIENSLLLYSDKNYSTSNSKIKINSYYNNYMDDVSNSGVKKFNFIEVLPNDSLIINLKDELVENYAKYEFTYYYFHKEKRVELINVTDAILSEKTLTFNAN